MGLTGDGVDGSHKTLKNAKPIINHLYIGRETIDQSPKSRKFNLLSMA